MPSPQGLWHNQHTGLWVDRFEGLANIVQEPCKSIGEGPFSLNYSFSCYISSLIKCGGVKMTPTHAAPSPPFLLSPFVLCFPFKCEAAAIWSTQEVQEPPPRRHRCCRLSDVDGAEDEQVQLQETIRRRRRMAMTQRPREANADLLAPPSEGEIASSSSSWPSHLVTFSLFGLLAPPFFNALHIIT